MRVFLDTNVLASALMARGLCAELFEIIVAEHEALIGEPVIKELKTILARKFRVPSSLIAETESMLRTHTMLPGADSAPKLRIKDRDDPWIIACALAGQADLFVTGDREVIELEAVSGMPIVAPRACWERLRSA